MLDGTVNDVRGTPPLGGLAGSLLTLWRGLIAGRAEPRRRERELRLVETLHVGGRRQLLLVSCAGERFLVGTSADGIGSIVPVPVNGRPACERCGVGGPL